MDLAHWVVLWLLDLVLSALITLVRLPFLVIGLPLRLVRSLRSPSRSPGR